MTNDTKDKPKGRVLTQSRPDIFKSISGGRSDYGGLIISALTGKSQTELVEGIAKKLQGEALQSYKKAVAEGGEVMATLLDAEDQFFQDYLRISAGPSLIAPPIAPERLERLVAENNAVEPCIAAMTTNISCTGMQLLPTEGGEADLTDADKEARKNLMDFFKECNPRTSFLRVRKQLRRDLHTTGNSYMVVERTLTGELAFVRRAPAKSMRMIKLDDAVPVAVKMRRGGKEVELTVNRAERRFVQKIGTKLVYYKEYGSQRDLNRVTGEWAKEGQTIAPNKRAHEVIHDKDIEDVKSPYGMPRWITQLPSVLGSRMAEEHNLAYFQSGGVPPVMVFITGGIVSEEVAKAINNYLDGGSKDKQRGVAVEVPSSGDLGNEKAAQISVERFGSQEADSTFENYDEKCEKRIRKAFRLPGIFLGMSDNYNFATAHASYVVAEAQVFAPERDEEDERINMTIMREIDPEGMWKVVSNPLSVQDVNLQLKGIQMLSAIRGVGLSDVVDAISQVTGLEIELGDDYTEAVVGDTSTIVPPEGPEGQEPGDGTPAPPSVGTEGNGQAPANAPEPPAPGVTSQVANSAQVLAARIARAVKEFDDMAEARDLDELLGLEKGYDDLPPGGQDIVNKALGPILYHSTFLSGAALADMAAGYAKAAFNAARYQREQEMETA